jgi:hypothetical protein
MGSLKTSGRWFVLQLTAVNGRTCFVCATSVPFEWIDPQEGFRY